MTVKELIELNQLIVDVRIEVRVDGTKLLDYLGIGCDAGIKPRYPVQVPKDISYINRMDTTSKRDGRYIDKSINTWDDNRDYWQLKTGRIPSAWLNLEVYSWRIRRAYRNTTKIDRDEAESILIVALPSGEALETDKPKQSKQIDGQMTMADLIEGSKADET